MRSVTSTSNACRVALLATFGIANVAGAVDFDAASPCVNNTALSVATTLDPPALQVGPIPREMVDGMGRPLGDTLLEGYRGGDDGPEQTVDIDGSVTGNTANRIVSGTNNITDGAFGNASGINTVIQNTGSNVLIQNGMVVNVQFADPGL